MRQSDVLEHTRRQPFEPFRIILSDGQAYDVRHPDMCIAGPSSVYVGVDRPGAPGGAVKVDHISLFHVVRFEPLDGEGKAGSQHQN
jgi:hypothetical protein